jgi:hypothetical protein
MLCAAAPGTVLLREQAWTPPGPDAAFIMTSAPRECLTTQSDRIEAGRALFRSPNLLGGPAARAGLSCHACHTNGRVNPYFALPELTDRPGAADVTSEWASQVRGDGVANPVDIPDLAGAGSRASFGRARDPSLEHFVHGVIVEEFQGAPPPPEAFASLIAYLRALDACALTNEPITLASAVDDVRRAVRASTNADAATASLLLLAAQDSIGRIVERLPQPRFRRDRRTFETLARELGAWRNAEDVALAQSAALPGWQARFDAAAARTARRERQTYFNQTTLERALQQR